MDWVGVLWMTRSINRMSSILAAGRLFLLLGLLGLVICILKKHKLVDAIYLHVIHPFLCVRGQEWVDGSGHIWMYLNYLILS
jgi:hypothetical protein